MTSRMRAPFGEGRDLFAMAAVLLAIALVGGWLIDRQAHDRASQRLQVELLRVATHRAGELELRAGRLRSDTLLMASMPPVAGIMRSSGAGGADPVDGSTTSLWKDRLRHIFAAYLRTNPDAAQLRFIGIADGGREIVRVDRRGTEVVAISEAELQEKGERDYLRRALRLPDGVVLVDGPSLNQENGRVEVPHRAMIRFATPVRNGEGATFGAIVLNIDMDGWLRTLMTALPSGYLPHLTNRDGEFVLHPDPSRAFAFDLGGSHTWRGEFELLAGSQRDDGESRVEQWRRREGGRTHLVATAAIRMSPDPSSDSTLQLHMLASSDLMADALSSARRETLLVSLLLAAVATGGAFLFQRGERRRRALQLEQGRLAAIVESSQDAIIGQTLDGVVTSWNRGAELLFGWRAEEMIGQSIQRIVPEPLHGEARHALDAVSAGNVIENLQTERLRKDGGRVRVAATFSPIRDGSGRVVGASKIARDVTGERAAAERLEGEHARLEGEVELRTAALQRALNRAEQADRAKGQFVANMSHEIRTPLNAVLGMLTLIERGGQVRQLQDYAQKASTAANSLLRLIDDLLDFSRIESGRLEIEAAPFAPEFLFRDLAVIMGEQRHHPEVELVFDLDPSLPAALRGDRLRLQQVLTNLIGNALKFTQRGNVLLKAHHRPAAEDDTASRVRVDFEVVDNGIGMSADQLARVFRPFVQADASTSRRYGGSGLGLVISRRLVEAMGGALEGSSTEGEGSRFAFSLEFPCSAGELPAPARQPLAGKRVLVVDDNPLCRDVLRLTLERLGAESFACESGKAALDQLSADAGHTSRLDVVLMDYLMPGLDGLSTARQLVDLPGRPASRVVMITAHGGDFAEALRSVDGQSWSWLAKPVTPGQLVEAVLGDFEEDDRALPGGRLSGVRLLVAEDNPLSRQVASELLAAEGASVTCVEDGEQAVLAVESPGAHFDAVLMDVQMPNMDGLAATRQLREKGYTSLPVIALTANAYSQDRDDCIQAGMDAHVGKPFDIGQLIPVLMRLLGRPAVLSHLADSAQAVTPQAGQSDLLEDAGDRLRRFAGHQDALLRTLQRFPAEARRIVNALRQAASTGDARASEIAAHALKGVAATVGAPRLREAAARLESDARRSDPSDGTWAVRIEDVATLVDRTTASLQSLIDPETISTRASAPADGAGLALQQLAGLLSRFERGELGALDSLRSLCAVHEHDEDWRAVADAVDALDAPALRRAAARLGADVSSGDDPAA